MSQQQRDAVDALMRSFPFVTDVAEQRAVFAERQTSRPVPDGVMVEATVLGGRPATEVTTGVDGPVLLHLHGGGYVVGSDRTGAVLAAALVARTGGRALVPDYRLAPEHPFPAAVEDGLAAYRDLLRTTRAERIVLTGDSAGGGLAIATLLAARDAGLPQPAAVAVFSPFTDLTLSGASVRGKDGADPLFTRDRLAYYADRYVTAGTRADPLASPVFADLAGLPPLLVQVGSHELLLDDAMRLAARAGEADVAVTLEVWPGVPHVFQNLGAVLDEAGEALDGAARFLTGRLLRPA